MCARLVFPREEKKLTCRAAYVVPLQDASWRLQRAFRAGLDARSRTRLLRERARSCRAIHSPRTVAARAFGRIIKFFWRTTRGRTGHRRSSASASADRVDRGGVDHDGVGLRRDGRARRNRLARADATSAPSRGMATGLLDGGDDAAVGRAGASPWRRCCSAASGRRQDGSADDDGVHAREELGLLGVRLPRELVLAHLADRRPPSLSPKQMLVTCVGRGLYMRRSKARRRGEAPCPDGSFRCRRRMANMSCRRSDEASRTGMLAAVPRRSRRRGCSLHVHRGLGVHQDVAERVTIVPTEGQWYCVFMACRGIGARRPNADGRVLLTSRRQTRSRSCAAFYVNWLKPG